VRLEDLADGRRLRELHAQFNRVGVINGGEGDWRWFVGAAVHALRVGDKNPCGLFVALVRNRDTRGLWVTQADEDEANRRIKIWEDGG